MNVIALLSRAAFRRAPFSSQTARPAVLPLVLAAVAACGLAACHREAPAAAAPAFVVALPVHHDAGTGGDAIRYPVEVAARYTNVMSFRVAGKLIERKVRLGDTVRKGQVVARLDPSDAQKQVVSDQAALEAADHRLVFAKQQLDRDNGAGCAEPDCDDAARADTGQLHIGAGPRATRRPRNWSWRRTIFNTTRWLPITTGRSRAKTRTRGRSSRQARRSTALPGAGHGCLPRCGQKAISAASRSARPRPSRFPRCRAANTRRVCARWRRPPTRRAGPIGSSSRLLQPGDAVHLGMTGDARLAPAGARDVAVASAASGANATALAASGMNAAAARAASGTNATAAPAAGGVSGPNGAGRGPAAADTAGRQRRRRSVAGHVYPCRPPRSSTKAAIRPSGSFVPMIRHSSCAQSAWVATHDHSVTVTGGLKDGEQVVLAGRAYRLRG